MKRSHIHCATGMLGAEGVKSGAHRLFRAQLSAQGCALRAISSFTLTLRRRWAVRRLRAQRMLTSADGIAFSVSSNGVVLTKGIDGRLPARFFAKVVDRTGNIVPAPAV